MTIRKEQSGSALTVVPEGRLDTVTSPELEAVLTESLEGVDALTIDLAGLDYISSAGLRVLLSTLKRMKRQGTMVIKNVSGPIMEIFEVTGFNEILTIE